MKLELKSINIVSIIFSAFPLIVFALSLVNAFFAVTALSEFGIMEKVMQGVLWALAETMVILVTALVVAFVYNLFCSFGIRGVRFEIAEVGQNEVQEGNE